MSEVAAPTTARVLATRLVVGATLVAAVVGIFVVDASVGAGAIASLVVASLALLAQFEFYAMVRRAGFPVATGFGVLAGAYFLGTRFLPLLVPEDHPGLSFYDSGAQLALVAIAVLVRGVLRARTKEAPLEAATTLLGVLAVPFLLGYAIEIRLLGGARAAGLLVFLVAVTKTCDSCAYFAGVARGGPRLAPAVSPGKTWSGAVGGFLGAVAVASILGALDAAGGLTLTEAAGAGIILAVASQFADLAESLLKRGCGVKDSAALLPALGGALDLLDSFLFAAPALRFYLSVLRG